MGNSYFFTGFPGFIARGLLREMIKKGYPINHVYLLVQPQMIESANKVIAELADGNNVTTEMFTVIPGDITKKQLDIPDTIQKTLEGEVTHVFHLAAIYDLAVPKDIAYHVNVNGTEKVNEWVQTLENLKRYIYFSTAYVSGTREGKIYEHELEMGQSFKNHYESTKYEAEVLVRKIIDRVPTTIIRPGIVKGHSKTGETIKFDGPYFILNLLETMKFLPAIPYFGTGEADGNFVPIDYIYGATLFLGHDPIGEGNTYHLTDPNPYKLKDIYRMLMEEYLGKKPFGVVPMSIAKATLSIPMIRKWLKVEKEAMDYFTCMAYYDSSNAAEHLKASDVKLPDFKGELKPMVQFYREYKDDRTKHLVIR